MKPLIEWLAKNGPTGGASLGETMARILSLLPFWRCICVFADIDPFSADELGKAIGRDADRGVSGAARGHDFVEALQLEIEEHRQFCSEAERRDASDRMACDRRCFWPRHHAALCSERILHLAIVEPCVAA